MNDLPDIWGDGHLFAFSGLDGPTDATARFVGLARRASTSDPTSTSDAARYGVDFGPRSHRGFRILCRTGDPSVATSDVLVTLPSDNAGENDSDGGLVLTWAAWHTLIGELPRESVVEFTGDDGQRHHVGPITDGTDWQLIDRADARVAEVDAVLIMVRGHRLLICYGRSDEQCRERADRAARLVADDVVTARLAFVAQVPAGITDAASRQLAAKCLSVMRVNSLSAGDTQARAWSTPDRVPHQHMWLWDTAFHSLAMNLVAPAVAHEHLRAVIDTAQADGMIPLCRFLDGRTATVSQPPLLAWAMAQNRAAGGTATPVDDAVLQVMEAHLDWFRDHRTDPALGLPTWQVHEDPLCRSGESGLDNSPRFDGQPLGACVDLAVWCVQDLRALATLRRERGDADRADALDARATTMATRVVDELWDEEHQFFYDLMATGEHSPVRAVTGFLPVLLPEIRPEQLDALERALADSGDFGTPMPLPSVSRREPSHGHDMWRGPVWLNMSYLVSHGLLARHRTATATTLMERTIDVVARRYRESGAVFEFYDADDLLAPAALDRKGPVAAAQSDYDPDRQVTTIRDFHWSAACTLLMINTLAMR